ncbi:DUF2946 family protein [Xanthomonas axonopodis pv. poinsettiicola]
MQRLACLSALLLLCAPLVSRALDDASRFLDVPLCQSGPWHIGDAPKAVNIDAHAMQLLAGTQAGADHQVSSARHDQHNADGGHAADCDYCLLAARLLSLVLLACLLFAPIRNRLAVARIASIVLLAARWCAHAPRGPPLVA